MPWGAPHCGLSTATLPLVWALEMMLFNSFHPDSLGDEVGGIYGNHSESIIKIDLKGPPSQSGTNQIPIAWRINVSTQITVAVSFSALC
jgi:hypothetical protein